ncbi:MAG: short-chain fatty acid transporter [Verrucomicrobia bacterium]|nr:short-chain fatty acid transporter [Verrucomicrobiota bacterium]MBV8641765.1 short-chain fatty acid transporter [Verrucomicrobiota bacterium]
MTAKTDAHAESTGRRTALSSVTSFFLYVFERITPDPYIFAIGLTILTALLAAIFAPKGSADVILTGWYTGLFSILAFAFQMVLVLVTGYALSNSRPVKKFLGRLAGVATTPKRAVVVILITVMATSFINWGCGLVVAGLLAREIAKRIRIDFGWLVAAAYSGWIIWASGLSSSIALAQATPGSALNIVQKITGKVLPLSETVFAPFNLVPVLLLVVLVPILYCAIQPAESDTVTADSARLIAEDQVRPVVADELPTLARRLERAWFLNLIIVVAGIAALGIGWAKTGFTLDINSVIFLFFIAGLLLHWTPIAYVEAVNSAARVTGPLILQYPLYGGIMGVMTATGLADVISKAFVAFSSAHTLPFWNFVASMIISLFIPSGGGHWAVQGPFTVPAAAQLNVSQAATAMAVAMGEQVTNMIQPFWALPVLAIAGISMRRVMGFTVMSFFVGAIVFGMALLFLV